MLNPKKSYNFGDLCSLLCGKVLSFAVPCDILKDKTKTFAIKDRTLGLAGRPSAEHDIDERLSTQTKQKTESRCSASNSSGLVRQLLLSWLSRF